MATAVVCIDDLDLPEVDLDGDAYMSDPVAELQRCRLTSWLIRTTAFGIQVLSHEVAVQMIRDRRLNGPGPDMYLGMARALACPGDISGLSISSSRRTFPAIVHDDVYETLTDADKEVLGIRVIREFGGAIGPRWPGDRRSNLNVRYPHIPELGKAGANAPSPGSHGKVAAALELTAMHNVVPG